MIKAVNKSGVLMQEVRNIANDWFDMKAKGAFDNEDDAFFYEEENAKGIVHVVHCWLLQRRGGEIDDETMKEFVGILLGQRL
ncbi:MAG: hypothetical protein KIB45_05780 [Negativicoccus succinicivorans]|uniref:hypothetical protein n=1 Tax=Negativicoccus succinicivorans TaxID=620903 RepID=UPI0023522C56|nr:hypothetical protein [Negativicoccus succinicivorans]MBS5890572.1 hypothetical protein [Negativicoccus succinicivorans]